MTLHRPLLSVAIIISLLTAPAVSFAQPGPAPADVAKSKDEAQAHFTRGLSFSDKAAWDAALAEFLTSIELYPTRAAMKNAGVCLRKLNRYDEALEQYERIFREFKDVPDDIKVAAQRAIVELRPLVGTIQIDAAEPGAAITVDGRRRGEHPLVAPLRVNAGSHVVRVYREGFDRFEASVDVAGGETARVAARLARLVQSGRLRVSEKSGKALDVSIDGNIVGVTPWEGPVAVGEHTVMLRGEERFGAPPSPVSIRLGERAELSLAAEELDAVMRVAPVPAEASVAVDGLFVGRGAWEGRVRPGTHKVELVADGYFKVEQQVKVERGGREAVSATLKRDSSSPRWRKPGHFMLELGGAAALWPSFGGDIARSCTGACTHGLAVGGEGVFHGGYELGSGFGFGIEVGYLRMRQSTTGRPTSLTPVGRKADAGTADDIVTVGGFRAGAFAALGFGEKVPLRLRLGAGALIGSISDSRAGTFTPSDGSAKFSTGPLVVTPGAAWFYLDPEARVGVRLGRHFELSAGIGVLMLISPSARTWPQEQRVNVASDGEGHFDAKPLTNAVLFAVTPGASARYDF